MTPGGQEMALIDSNHIRKKKKKNNNTKIRHLKHKKNTIFENNRNSAEILNSMLTFTLWIKMRRLGDEL